MTQILICGDPHGDFTSILSAVKKYSTKAIVMLGDYDLAAAIGAKQIFHGHHHEFYKNNLNGIEVVGVDIRAVCILNGEQLEISNESRKK